MRYRFARSDDFKTLQSLLPVEFRPSQRVRDSLFDLWHELNADGRLRMSVVEDPELGTQLGIQIAGISGFVRDDFLQEYLADPYPGVAAEIYERVLDGRSPLLSEAEIRAANSGRGLNLVMLHFAMRNPDLSEVRVQQAMVAVNASFFFFYGGYRLRSAMQEVYGLQAAKYMEAGGFRIASDFAGSSADDVPATSREQPPFLLLLRKEEVQPSVVNPLSFLFYPVPPRIHFSPAEQKLLERALLNQSDLEISQDLGVSLDAVKKTWRRIYQRSARVTPHLLGADEANNGTASRGMEKRRHLLDYLRIHLEELRPTLAKHSGAVETSRV
jgi:hypothetical protein